MNTKQLTSALTPFSNVQTILPKRMLFSVITAAVMATSSNFP